VPRRGTRRTPGHGKEVVAPSNIRIIEKVHGGEEVPPDGGIIRPENVRRGTEYTIWGKVVASPEFWPW